MHFSQWLRKRIEEAQITQNELAETLQISPGMVSNWLADRHTPNESNTLTIAVFFTQRFQNVGDTLLSCMQTIVYTKQNKPQKDA